MKHDMAHKGIPLAYTPEGPIWEEDLDVTWSERRKQIAGTLFLLIVLIGVALLSGGPQ